MEKNKARRQPLYLESVIKSILPRLRHLQLINVDLGFLADDTFDLLNLQGLHVSNQYKIYDSNVEINVNTQKLNYLKVDCLSRITVRTPLDRSDKHNTFKVVSAKGVVWDQPHLEKPKGQRIWRGSRNKRKDPWPE